MSGHLEGVPALFAPAQAGEHLQDDGCVMGAA
jgi:hypothetical protein